MAADNFSKAQVTVTMTGEQWLALMARVARKPLSPEGVRIAGEAAMSLLERLDSFVTGVAGKRLTYSDLIH